MFPAWWPVKDRGVDSVREGEGPRTPDEPQTALRWCSHREAAFARERSRRGQQPGLADARLAVQHERAAATLDSIEQRSQQLDLGVPAEQRRGVAPQRSTSETILAPAPVLPEPASRTESDDVRGHRALRPTVLTSTHFTREGVILATDTVRNVVLVHGGFVDGSGWQGVYESLARDGFRVSIAQNPTLSL